MFGLFLSVTKFWQQVAIFQPGDHFPFMLGGGQVFASARLLLGMVLEHLGDNSSDNLMNPIPLLKAKKKNESYCFSFPLIVFAG